jgi:hypothetical protein
VQRSQLDTSSKIVAIAAQASTILSMRDILAVVVLHSQGHVVAVGVAGRHQPCWGRQWRRAAVGGSDGPRPPAVSSSPASEMLVKAANAFIGALPHGLRCALVGVCIVF